MTMLARVIAEDFSSDADDRSDVIVAAIRDCAEAIEGYASQCDSLCLVAGKHLCDAVPTLATLSTQFTTLSESLRTGAMFAASGDLSLLAEEVRAIGSGLSHEGACLDALIQRNALLARQISDVMDDVRFLVAMVSNAKVELASVADEGEGLDSFGKTLEDIATRSDRTLRDYQVKHAAVLAQLRRTAELHGAFQRGHKSKLFDVAIEIDASVQTFDFRYKAIMAAAAGIGAKSQTITSRIAETVMALQVGDRTRQRIEHAREGLAMAQASLEPGASEETEDTRDWGKAARLCHLQPIQIEDAAAEFRAEMGTTRSLLAQVASDVDGLLRPDESLATGGALAFSFLGDLEPKLRMAEDLIKACQASRLSVDGIADVVMTRFEELDRLAATVAAMVIEMTIVGTNAIVKFYRLGQRGAALSIIAQHLRSHALKIADGIKVLTPTMAEVRADATTFVKALEGQDSERIAALARRMTDVVAAFREAGVMTGEAMATLERDASSVHGLLTQAVTGLDVIVDYDVGFIDIAGKVERIGGECDGLGPAIAEAEDAALGAMLRPRYTMAAERDLHDAFFSTRPSAGRGAGGFTDRAS
jgi:hypothetical protein